MKKGKGGRDDVEIRQVAHVGNGSGAEEEEVICSCNIKGRHYDGLER